jgi:hypothetical protein
MLTVLADVDRKAVKVSTKMGQFGQNSLEKFGGHRTKTVHYFIITAPF